MSPWPTIPWAAPRPSRQSHGMSRLSAQTNSVPGTPNGTTNYIQTHERSRTEKHMKRGNKLRQLRLERGLTVDQVAEAVEMTKHTIYVHESVGLRNPRPEIVHKYADLYDITTEQVVRALMSSNGG